MSLATFRKHAKAELGQLAQVFQTAMRLWDADKAAGMPLGERLRNLEQTLRAAWPQTREWKYLCQQCHDYGLVMNVCPGLREAICGRTKPHYAHEFGTPCWCSAGQRFKDKPKPTAEDFTMAGKSKPTRVGR